MKKTFLTMTILLILVSLSCSKNQSSIQTSLAGQWNLVEEFDGYVNGGSFTWKNIPSNYDNKLELLSNNTFFETEKNNNQTITCSGYYSFNQSDSSFVLNSSCNNRQQQYKLTELNNGYLILDLGVIEGKIRYKYKKK